MKIIISLSAETYAKGERVLFKAGKNRWYAATVTSVRAGNVGLLFDDGLKGAPSKPSSRTWKKITTKKKFKTELTDSQAEALIPKAVPAKPVKAIKAVKVAKAVKSAKAPVKVAKNVKMPVNPIGKPGKPAPKPVKAPKTTGTQPVAKLKQFVGSIVRAGRFGEVVILSNKYGRKYMEYKWAQVSDQSKTGWLKIPIGRDPFASYTYIRTATESEMHGGKQALQKVAEKKSERTNQAYEKIKTQDIKAGDIVMVAYKGGSKKEAVLEVDYRSMQVALVRQYSSAAEHYTKRRMMPLKWCEKVADGGGKFDPNNELYKKHGIYVPDFYKSGQKVAARRPRRSAFMQFGL